eukprot:768144-Hanusia_phi.AAC.1
MSAMRRGSSSRPQPPSVRGGNSHLIAFLVNPWRSLELLTCSPGKALAAVEPDGVVVRSDLEVSSLPALEGLLIDHVAAFT